MRRRSSQRSRRCLSIGPMQPFATSAAASLASCHEPCHSIRDHQCRTCAVSGLNAHNAGGSRSATKQAFGQDTPEVLPICCEPSRHWTNLQHMKTHKVRVRPRVGLHGGGTQAAHDLRCGVAELLLHSLHVPAPPIRTLSSPFDTGRHSLQLRTGLPIW